MDATDSFKARPLPVLRAMIDAVDHEILQSLSRRNGLVAEIAAYKREHRVPIRDLAREAEIITDSRHRATPLGLPPELIESLYRLILWGSRDRQAALRAEVPPDIEPRTVAVIGGSGAMGRLLADLFGDLGHAVIRADLDTSVTPPDAAAAADVVIISVPIEQTLNFTSPVYLMELLMTARHFAQSPDLYASIQMSNARTPTVTEAFVESARELREIIEKRDRGSVEAMFEEVRSFFGPFTDQALEQSSFLIDRLVERM
ncbi:MAG: chorismate mutase [Planctomycetota bacterium]|jgi:chorismate mutase